jgi:hypothetical protein
MAPLARSAFQRLIVAHCGNGEHRRDAYNALGLVPQKNNKCRCFHPHPTEITHDLPVKAKIEPAVGSAYEYSRLTLGCRACAGTRLWGRYAGHDAVCETV